MRKTITTTIALVLAAAASAAYAQTSKPINIATYNLGESADKLDAAYRDERSALRGALEQMRQSGGLTGAGDPHFSTAITETPLIGGYEFTLAGLRILTTCKAHGTRIYAIMQDREFMNVTADDVTAALLKRFGPSGRKVNVEVRPGMTYIDRWLLWGTVPQGLDGAMVGNWGNNNQQEDVPFTFNPGLSAHVLTNGHRVTVRIARYAPEIAADAHQCAAEARGAARQQAVSRIKF